MASPKFTSRVLNFCRIFLWPEKPHVGRREFQTQRFHEDIFQCIGKGAASRCVLPMRISMKFHTISRMFPLNLLTLLMKHRHYYYYHHPSLLLLLLLSLWQTEVEM
jgi:hypothetical protein